MSKRKPHIQELDPTVVSEVFMRRVAILAMGGSTKSAIAKELGLAVSAIESIQQLEGYKKYLKRVAEDEANFALIGEKTRLQQQLSKAGKVYEKLMDDYLIEGKGAREAATIAQAVHRSAGLDKTEQQMQDTKITIKLPDGADVVTFDAEEVE